MRIPLEIPDGIVVATVDGLSRVNIAPFFAGPEGSRILYAFALSRDLGRRCWVVASATAYSLDLGSFREREVRDAPRMGEIGAALVLAWDRWFQANGTDLVFSLEAGRRAEAATSGDAGRQIMDDFIRSGIGRSIRPQERNPGPWEVSRDPARYTMSGEVQVHLPDVSHIARGVESAVKDETPASVALLAEVQGVARHFKK